MQRHHWIALALALLTFAAFEPLRANGFIDFDDRDYITGNPHVRAGWTASGVAWAFNLGYASNWHPLTWLSHMLDVSLFGVERPGLHHLMNLALHAASVVVLFLLLRRMTGETAKCAFVAAAFAVHPLRVESVAWASERKDVLSALLGFLALLAWVGWTERGGALRYASAVALYAFGLMAKPMLVTLPFLMLLLDEWPLRRLARNDRPGGRRVRELVLEKLPFFALSVALCPITFIAQSRGGAVAEISEVTVGTRLANAVSSYAAYLGKAVWPAKLSIFYPYPESFVAWKVAACALLLVGATLFALVQVRKRPWLTIGWLWWVGMLVPVIGLVQVGPQAMADRNTYVPLVGLAIVAAYGAGELAGRWPALSRPLVAAALTIVAAWAFLTRAQTKHWKDEVTVFRRAAEVTEKNHLAWSRVGHELLERGELSPALASLRKALESNPGYAYVHYDIGRIHERQGDLEAAGKNYLTAVQLDPKLPEPHEHLGNVLAAQGRFSEADGHYERALALAPGMAAAHNDYGVALAKRGRSAEAVARFTEALRLNPEFGDAWLNLGATFANAGRFQEASDSLRKGLSLEPDRPEARALLEQVLQQLAPSAQRPRGG